MIDYPPSEFARCNPPCEKGEMSDLVIRGKCEIKGDLITFKQ